MKTTNIFLAITAAALLCQLFLPCSLRAQDVAFCFPENMYWTATQVAEQVLTIDTDQEWEIYGYGSDFSVGTNGNPAIAATMAYAYDPDIARWNRIDPLAGEQQAFSPYSFCGGNPILQVDADGQVFETVWDAASLVMGVKSFVQNVKEGNVGAAIMDGVGIIGDALAVATPLVPGGVSAGIAAVRVGKNIDHVVDATKNLDHATNATRKAASKYEKLQSSAKIGQEAHRQIEAEIRITIPDADIEHTLNIGGGKNSERCNIT